MPKRYHTIVNLIALSIIAYVGVGIFYTVMRSKLMHIDKKTVTIVSTSQAATFQKKSLSDYRAIMEKNLFGSADKPPEEEEKVEIQDIEALEPTTLKVSLLGTVTGSPRNAFAVIEETNKRTQGLYKVGDTIQNAVIKMILRGKVVLTVGDKDEILTMEETPTQPPGKERVASRPASSRPVSRQPPPQRPEPRSSGEERTVTVERSDVQESLTNINKLLSEVRIRPHFRDGKPDGLAVSRIKEESLFSKLGLQDGDIVQAVNDKQIRSPDDVLSLYKRLRTGTEVAIQIERRGRSQTINYRFE